MFSTPHLLRARTHAHTHTYTATWSLPLSLFFSIWVSLTLAGMQQWPSGPAHLWEQSAISPRPCYHSKHLASFGRFVDFCPLVFSLLLL